MTLRRIVLSISGAGALVGAIVASASPAFSQETVNIVAFGGAPQVALRKAYFEPFAKASGITVREDEWGSALGQLQTMVKSGNPTWDVVNIGSNILDAACNQGLIEPLDMAQFGGKDRYVAGTLHECGIAASISANIIGVNASKFSGPAPKTMADFWDVAKFPGKRGLRDRPDETLEFALLADGVPADKVYELLGTEAGVARAFKKLDQIKPHVIWWNVLTQGIQQLIDGETAMSKLTNHRLLLAAKDKPHIQLIWDGGITAGGFWTIIKGARNRAAAVKFIQFANQHDAQLALPPLYPYGVPLKSVNAALPPEIGRTLASHPDNAKLLMEASGTFWADYIEDYNVRFKAWLSK